MCIVKGRFRLFREVFGEAAGSIHDSSVKQKTGNKGQVTEAEYHFSNPKAPLVNITGYC